MPLLRPSERSAACTVRSGARVHELPRDAGSYVTIDLILDAGAVAQLAIDRQTGYAVHSRDWRTVIGKSRRPEPFFTESKLVSDRDLTRIRKMQVGLDSPLLERGNSNRELSKRRPVLPSYVSHQAPIRSDVVESAQHHLLRHFHRDIDLYAADSRAKTA